ncbi:MAG TPA: RseA family anti-sigma factor [Nevskiales bacterium]|nr:RseA family anti-sigma factor [Nevskiales bacterium]
MTDTHDPTGLDEALSAFLDGESSPDETHALLDRLRHDAALQAALDRHHRLRAQLRGELHPGLDAGFAERVLAGIEAAQMVPRPRLGEVTAWRRPPLMRMTLGLAMAASVAAVTILAVQTLLPPANPAFPVLTAATSDVRPAAGERQAATELSPDAAAELNDYLISHNHSALDHGFSAGMGFMRVAAHEGIDAEGGGR